MHIPRNIHKIIELLIVNCYIGKREKVRFHYQCKHRHCTACTQTMAENNGKSMETPALKATIPEKLGKCFLYFPSHCNVFVHFRGHHCKGTPPEKMRNCRRAKGSGRAVVTGLSTGTVTVTVTQTASLKSHAPREKDIHHYIHRVPRKLFMTVQYLEKALQE